MGTVPIFVSAKMGLSPLWGGGGNGAVPLWPLIDVPARMAGRQAAVAQLVEHRLPKPNVEGPNPFCRSNLRRIAWVLSYTQAYHAGDTLSKPEKGYPMALVGILVCPFCKKPPHPYIYAGGKVVFVCCAKGGERDYEDLKALDVKPVDPSDPDAMPDLRE